MASPSFPFITDLLFELFSKGLLLVVIEDIHDTVFNEQLRLRRKLRELWCMMSALWESSSDIIAISVKSSERRREKDGCAATAMVSPTLEQLERAIFASRSGSSRTASKQQQPRKRRDLGDARAVVFELEASDFCITPGQTSSFSYVKDEESDDEDTMYRLEIDNNRVNPKRVHQIQLKGMNDDTTMTQNSVVGLENHNGARPEGIIAMGELLVRAWQVPKDEEVLVHDIERKEPITGKRRRIRCEAKVTRLDDDSMIVVVRDETDKYRSDRAEKLVLMERMARQLYKFHPCDPRPTAH